MIKINFSDQNPQKLIIGKNGASNMCELVYSTFSNPNYWLKKAQSVNRKAPQEVFLVIIDVYNRNFSKIVRRTPQILTIYRKNLVLQKASGG